MAQLSTINLFIFISVGIFILLFLSYIRLKFNIFRFKYKTRSVLTQAEINFQKRLYKLMPRSFKEKFILVEQAPFSSFLETKQGFKAFAKIAQKRCDWLIVDRVTYLPFGIIELDDSSHLTKKFKDKERDQLTASAGLITFRYTFKTPDYIIIQNFERFIKR